MKAVKAKHPKLGTRGRPEETRAAILQAALLEFAEHGEAGARTEAIAHSAGVNKALIHYYFKDKEGLYGAVLDSILLGLREQVVKALERKGTPRERLRAYITAHFDYIAEFPRYPLLLHREMMSGHLESPQLRRAVGNYLLPLHERLVSLLREGMRRGDFRKMEPTHTVVSMVGVIGFYFLITPAYRLMMGLEPNAPAQIAERRAAVLQFIEGAILQPEAAQRTRKKSTHDK
jgi:TetR/AcrR family transcriptional regulator